MRRLLTLGIAVAAGYAAAQALLDRELPADTPPPVRKSLEQARGHLQRAREQARQIFAAARHASDEAARDLMADYHRRAGRTDAPTPTSADPPPTSLRP